ncbi:MAG TPA: hypothetical protein DCZ72_02370 [Armatimonadetes bacterium]|mgnify:CR=1 FL=1|nr:hypothetical protein [Armatimonadota bacterium]
MTVGITHLVCRGDGTLPEVLDKIKAAGYTGMELLFTDYLYPGVDELQMDVVRAQFEAAGIEMLSMCGAGGIRGSLATGVEADVEEYIATTAEAARVAKYLGFDTILLVPGGVTPEHPYDLVLRRVTEGLKRLRPIADKYEVNLAVEYVWNDAFLSPLEMRAALDEADHPYIGFYMDTGNMLAFAWPEQWIRILGPHIKKVHVKNFRRRPHWDWPALLSVGDCNWPLVMAALRDIGYDGPLISEMSGTWEEHAENARFIQQLIAG